MQRITTALPTRHYVDAEGVYVGGFAAFRTITLDEATLEPVISDELPEIPAGAVEVPTSPPGIDWTWDGEKWVAPPAPPAPPPPEVADLLARIDAEAEAARGWYITPGSGQAMVYLAKQAEARAYQSAGEPVGLAAYPLLAAEVGITAPTAAEIATLWLAMEAQWVQAAAGIEALRLAAKAAVRAAAPEDREAAAVVAWPSP